MAKKKENTSEESLEEELEEDQEENKEKAPKEKSIFVKVSDETRSAHPEIPWKDIAGMRDRVVHDYFGVSLVRLRWEGAARGMASPSSDRIRVTDLPETPRALEAAADTVHGSVYGLSELSGLRPADALPDHKEDP